MGTARRDSTDKVELWLVGPVRRPWVPRAESRGRFMVSRVPHRQIDRIPDEKGAKRLAEQMVASGTETLIVDVDKPFGRCLSAWRR